MATPYLAHTAQLRAPATNGSDDISPVDPFRKNCNYIKKGLLSLWPNRI